jgi:hypothetical protein
LVEFARFNNHWKWIGKMNTITIYPEADYNERRSGLDRRLSSHPLKNHFNRRNGGDRRSSRYGRLRSRGADQKPPSKYKSLKFLFSKLMRSAPIDEFDVNLNTHAEEPPKAVEYLDRSNERYAYEATVLFEDYEVHKVSPARMYDYSKGGMYLETEHAPRIGRGAIIHMVNYAADASEPEDIRRYYGRVMWLNKISGMVVFNRYGVGVELCKDIDEFIELFGS